MLNQMGIRKVLAHVVEPCARGLLRIGLTPDAVTAFGTVGTAAAAFIFLTRGSFLIGTIVIALFIFSDLMDGTMARLSGRSGRWGAFLDSTLDRIGDGAIFSALLIWFARSDQWGMVTATTTCLIGGMVISYAKARAEGLGMTCETGLAERGERLLIVMISTFLAGLGVPYVQPVALWFLAGMSLITVGQRMRYVYVQALVPIPPTETGEVA